MRRWGVSIYRDAIQTQDGRAMDLLIFREGGALDLALTRAGGGGRGSSP